MGIRRYVLTKPFKIEGKNVWGFNSHIIFSPSSDFGWYLYNPKDQSEMPLNCQNMHHSKNNLFAKNGDSKMHVLEHILPLRWMGLDMVHIHGSPWPPYLTTQEMWDKLFKSGFLCETDDFIQNFKIEGTSNSLKRGSVVRQASIAPRESSRFRCGFDNIYINVHINYKGVGKLDKFYTLSNFENITGIYSQGFPKYRFIVCKLFEVLFKWPHLNRVVWARKRPNIQTLILWSNHRALDIFGCLAAIDHKKLPSDFQYFSHCGGHKHDLIATKKLKHV